MPAVSLISAAAPMAEDRTLRLARAAHEFEAQLMKELIRPMSHKGNEDDSGSGDALADFAGEALGQALSGTGGFGIADRIEASLRGTGASPDAPKSEENIQKRREKD